MATIYAVIEEAEQLLATLWSGVEDVVRLARKLTRNLPSKFDGTCSALEGQLQSLGGKEWCAFLSRHQESTNSWAIPQSLRSQVQNCRNGSVLKQRLRTSDGYWLPFPVIVALILKFVELMPSSPRPALILPSVLSLTHWPIASSSVQTRRTPEMPLEP